MSRCRYIPAEIIGYTPVFESAVGRCFNVPERRFCKHNGSGSQRNGLVTTGAGPCLVVVVHDTVSNRGCLAHLTETLTNQGAFNYALTVIERMIFSLIGQEGGERVQIFLLQGQGRFRGFGAFLEDGYLARCEVNNLIDNGFANYAYFPQRGEIFPVSRQMADSLDCNVLPQLIAFEQTTRQYPNEFHTDFSNHWGATVDGGR